MTCPKDLTVRVDPVLMEQAIVKHIIQYHNGRITVSFVKGKGTLFHIRLPSQA